ncbi:MAG: BON domain-containing protein [Sulfuricaulis sp.]
MGTSIDASIIVTQVESELLAGPRVKGLDMHAMTHNANVQLSSIVKRQVQIVRATVIASAVDGVKNVENYMPNK